MLNIDSSFDLQRVVNNLRSPKLDDLQQLYYLVLNDNGKAENKKGYTTFSGLEELTPTVKKVGNITDSKRLYGYLADKSCTIEELGEQPKDHRGIPVSFSDYGYL